MLIPLPDASAKYVIVKERECRKGGEGFSAYTKLNKLLRKIIPLSIKHNEEFHSKFSPLNDGDSVSVLVNARNFPSLIIAIAVKKFHK